ncbi:meiosis 1 arrest protein isoform X2 [Hyperolius riggenbachi]|uniref:meiosis 1 arrest protein isoform X2 n=1 Tax=Hyperolius riggenbachi TaxID=752182 RepID=UPI0035A34982
MLLPLAVLDALQQNRQITQHLSSGATMHCRFIEITVLSPRAGQEMAALLDEGLKEADLALLRRLMVVQIQCDVEDRASSRSPCSDSQDTRCHVYDIEFLTVAGDVISLECFFKSWLLKWSFEKEEVRLILPTRDTRLQIICDVQHPLLPPNLQDDEQKPRATTQTIRVMRALSSQGICGSMLYGLPSVLTPTACWELDWEELESNQENFHALCHQLQSEGLSLLGCSSQRSVSWAPAVMSYVIVTPCDTLAVLLRPVVTRELLLPIHPPTVTGPVADNAVHRIQEALSSLRVETVYNPLQVSSHLYQHLQTTLARPAAAPLRHVTTAFRGGRGHNRQLPSSSGRLRATIAPLTLVTPNPCKRGQQVQEDPPSKRRFHDEDEDGL